MSSNTPLAAGVAGAVVTSAAGPLAEVFSELFLMTAIMGAGGGLTLALSIRGRSFMDTIRSIFVGALLAGGFGVISPPVVAKLFDIEVGGSVQFLAAASFIIGMGQDMVSARLKKWSHK